jgi:glycosyltransferase involved in cell wall biosynthesis
VTDRPHGLKARVRRTVVAAVRWIAVRRHHFPAPVNRAVDWLRWHLPDGLVRRLTGSYGAPVDPRDLVPQMDLPPVPSTSTRIFIGPANFSGQGDLWVRSASRFLPDTGGISYALHVDGGFDFPADYVVTKIVYRKNSAWQRELWRYVSTGFTHVVIEAERPLFADLYRIDPFAEARRLEAQGVRVAMLAHGTDVRLPSRHARSFTWSPYRDRDWDVVGQLEAAAAKNLARLAKFPGPVFVSTPDLLDDVPRATWCPVVVDVDRWANDTPLLERDVAVVAHVPSNSRVKGTDQVDAAMATLVDEGLVSYERITGVASSDMPALYTGADIVLDQFRLGSYGVAACEAMAAGKVVVGNVTPEVRRRVRDLTGAELPIVQAAPDEIEPVVRDLLADRDRARAAAAAGPTFVRAVHDGSRSARQLAPFLGKETT